jgi:hypothetical protein
LARRPLARGAARQRLARPLLALLRLALPELADAGGSGLGTTGRTGGIRGGGARLFGTVPAWPIGIGAAGGARRRRFRFVHGGSITSGRCRGRPA